MILKCCHTSGKLWANIKKKLQGNGKACKQLTLSSEVVMSICGRSAEFSKQVGDLHIHKQYLATQIRLKVIWYTGKTNSLVMLFILAEKEVIIMQSVSGG